MRNTWVSLSLTASRPDVIHINRVVEPVTYTNPPFYFITKPLWGFMLNCMEQWIQCMLALINYKRSFNDPYQMASVINMFNHMKLLLSNARNMQHLCHSSASLRSHNVNSNSLATTLTVPSLFPDLMCLHYLPQLVHFLRHYRIFQTDHKWSKKWYYQDWNKKLLSCGTSVWLFGHGVFAYLLQVLAHHMPHSWGTKQHALYLINCELGVHSESLLSLNEVH